MAGTAGALLVVALLAGTLWPMPGAPLAGDSTCLICGDVGGADFAANLAAFVPLGVLLTIAMRSPVRAALLCAGLTLLIEALQWRLVPGRDASLGDLLANGAGGALGALLTAQWRAIALPRGPGAVVALAAWVTVSAAALSITSWLLTPSPVIYRLWSYWTPLQGGHVPFVGHLLGIRLYRTSLSERTRIEPQDMPPEYAQGLVELSLRFEGPLPKQGTAELFRLANTLEQRANVYVTATSMVFRPPVRATRWRFWSPSIRFPLPGDGAAGAQTEVRLRAARGAVFYEGAAHGDTIRASRRLSAGDGYRLFLSDVTLPRFSLMLLAAGWLGVLFAPFGVWAATSRKAGLAMAAAAVPAVVGFLAVPALLGMPIAGLGDWGAAIAMCLVGWAAGRLLTRHQNAMGPQLPGEAP